MIVSEITKLMDIIFMPLLDLHPILSSLFLSLLFSILSVFYQRMNMKKKEMSELRKKLEEMKRKLERMKKVNQKSKTILDEMIKLNVRLMRENLKIATVSIVLGILFLSWISIHYSSYYLKLPFPLFSKLRLVYFYILLCMIIGTVIGKIAEVR